jgi:hypothetical protein
MPASPTPIPRRAVRTGRRLAITTLLAIVALGAFPWSAAAADGDDPTPSPAPTATPTPTASTWSRTAPSATLSPLVRPMASPATTTASTTKVLIYRKSAMVKQYTNYWCVPATTQSMLNLVLGRSDRTSATQERYYKGTRKHNRYTYATKGNDPQGWAWALRYYSGGVTTYRDRAFTNKTAALQAIVESIDRTGTPVGVTVHRGTHAWIVLGYRAERDAADPTRRTILGFYVSGPLGSPKDPWPYGYMPMAEFRTHFSKYHEWQRSVIWEGRWVVVSQ